MLNRCEFIGNLGKAPEVRTMQSGDKVANFSIAVSEKWKDKATGETREKTEWVNVVAFGGLAGIVERYLDKGSKVYIAGKMQTRKWQDQEGRYRWSTEIVLSGHGATLEMLGGGGQKRRDEPAPVDDMLDDEVPF